MKDSYLTIGKETSGVYREKGSRFLSFAIPVKSEREALDHIERIRREYYDARHHCYAYVLERGGYHRVSDAGEPRHTAGDPIYNQIRSKDLSDILVVVVRYFGGTKLGKSGLINAYKMATSDALDNAVIAERIIYSTMQVRFVYDGLNDVMRIIDQHNLQIVDQSYGEEAVVIFRVRESGRDHIRELFSSLSCVSVIEESTG